MPGVLAGSEGVQGIFDYGCASHSRIATFARNDKCLYLFTKSLGWWCM